MARLESSRATAYALFYTPILDPGDNHSSSGAEGKLPVPKQPIAPLLL
jgi:hypothetical protein